MGPAFVTLTQVGAMGVRATLYWSASVNKLVFLLAAFSAAELSSIIKVFVATRSAC